MEGSTKTISVNVYERNPKARSACLDEYGYCCQVCDFEREYGYIGKGIHSCSSFTADCRHWRRIPIRPNQRFKARLPKLPCNAA